MAERITTGDRVKRIIVMSGMSINEISLVTGLQRNTIKRAINGDMGGYLDTWVRMARAVGFSIDEIAGLADAAGDYGRTEGGYAYIDDMR